MAGEQGLEEDSGFRVSARIGDPDQKKIGALIACPPLLVLKLTRVQFTEGLCELLKLPLTKTEFGTLGEGGKLRRSVSLNMPSR